MNYQKGVSLYFAVIVMALMMAIVLGITSIIIYSLKTVKEIGNSVVSLYAADTGIEKALYDDKQYRETNGVPIPAGSYSDSLEYITPTSSYVVNFDEGVIHATSTGSYIGIQRAVNIDRSS